MTSYSSCHEYTSRAVLRFDSTETSAGTITPRPVESATPTPSVSPFPEGLTFDCRIVTPIDSDTAAAGSPIEAILRSPLRGKDRAILAPRGARIHGRLVRLAEHKGTLDYFEVGVRLESVEVNGTRLPLYATIAHQAAPPLPLFAAFDVREAGDFPTAPPPNVGVFFFARDHLRVHQLDSAWLTTSPETGKENKTPKQSLEIEVLKRFILAVNYAQQATNLVWTDERRSTTSDNTWLFERYTAYPDLQDILTYRQKAMEVGKSADTDVLNRVYPGLGDRFKTKFVESMSLFVHGCNMQAKMQGTAEGELFQSGVLSYEWVEWYGANRKAIESAINLRQLNSEWTTASPDNADQHGVPPLSR